MKKKTRGSLTVEAAIILPVYLLVMFFVLNFMNIFYLQLAIQEGLNNTASILGKYCNVAAVTVGMDAFELSESNAENVTSLQSDITDLSNNLSIVIDILGSGFSLEKLDDLLAAGSPMADSVKRIANTAKTIGGEGVTNLLLSGGVELAGSAGVTAIMNDYLKEMRVNQNLLDGAEGQKIKFYLALDRDSDDIVLTAKYSYKDPMFSLFFDAIPMKQSVVVHPWVGGSTEGLRSSH